MKTITICGSSKFFAEMKQMKSQLENLWFEVYYPDVERTAIDYSKLNKKEKGDVKQGFIDKHIDKIRKSDAVLIANYTKENMKDRIGENSFLEIGFAYILKKTIFILNDIPEQANTIEIEGMKPITLKGDLNLLKNYK